MSDKPVIQPCQVRLRHIKVGAAGDPGAVQLLDAYLTPQPVEGLAGDQGWSAGNINPLLSDVGEFTITIPNTAGADGLLHRERFAVLTDRAYRPGDEWIEVYRSQSPLAAAGDLLFVGTPARGPGWNLTQLQLAGTDALGCLGMQRETDAGIWTGHAPRDVFYHYTGAWQPRLADPFTTPGRFTTSTVEQTTSDGLWDYTAVTETPIGAVELANVPGTEAGLYSRRSITSAVWRLELRVVADGAGAWGAYTQTGRNPAAAFEYNDGAATVNCTTYKADGTTLATKTVAMPPLTPLHTAIEQRDRWTWFFIDQDLVAVLPNTLRPGPFVQGARSYLTVLEAIARQWTPFLNRTGDKGDMQLPGDLPAGGLIGTYIDDTGRPFAELLHPAIDASTDTAPGIVQRREDLALNFPAANPPAWQPAGVPAANFSARWTGAIYLDLDSHDYAIRARADDRVRVWIGKTMFGEQLIDDWTSAGHAMTTTTGPWLKAGNIADGGAPSGSTGVLAGRPSGWYPIVVEYSQGSLNGGLIVESTRDDHRTTWTPLGTGTDVTLSPVGCHAGDPKHDSHQAQLEQLRDTFGLQYRVKPESLESGRFPATIRPEVLVGVDSNIIITTDDATGLGKTVSAEDVADQILLDTSSTGTREALDHATLNQQGAHLLHPRAYDSLADITIQAVAEQRALARLALQGTPWEELTAQPDGYLQQADTFPLTGAAAVFRWEPGDGVRLRFPELATLDATPRQLTSVSWPIRPDGLGQPEVRFRQRPRDVLGVLRGIVRRLLAAQRLS